MNHSSFTAARPQVVKTGAAARAAIVAARGQGRATGLVPTMGALHEGHLSLVRAAQAECGFTAVSIFVNPTQFGPQEDLGRYPRPLENDLAMLADAGVDLAFVPEVEEIYPAGFSTSVEPPSVADPLEGESRPGHFRGVATVVLKLFHLLPADFAYFGQKDYQQSLVIRRMVSDLGLPVEVRVCPIVRDPDGLAMSSRNRYLSDRQRQRALSLYRCLQRAEELAAQGELDAAAITAQMHAVLKQGGVDDVDYAALVDPETLQPVAAVNGPAIALVAAHVGSTRLIDNLIIRG